MELVLIQYALVRVSVCARIKVYNKKLRCRNVANAQHRQSRQRHPILPPAKVCNYTVHGSYPTSYTLTNKLIISNTTSHQLA